MAMERLTREVAEAVTVMGAAALAFGALRARLKAAQDEAAGKGVDIAALNTLADDLDANANALAAAIADNTAAAEEETAPEAPVVDPDADANPGGSEEAPADDAGEAKTDAPE